MEDDSSSGLQEGLCYARSNSSFAGSNSRRTQFETEPAGFRDILLEAVDYGLMVLGEIVRQAIYERIEKDHGVKRTEIPERLEAFHKALGSVLGVSAKTVERLIAKNLYQRLGLSFTPRPEWTLIEYVDHAKTTSSQSQLKFTNSV
jgi:hypothetical protein